MERVVPVLFVLQNSFAFYLKHIVIFHVLFKCLFCTVFDLSVAFPYFKLLYLPDYNAFHVLYI